MFVSIRLLENILSERWKTVPLSKCLDAVSRDYGVPKFNFKNISDELGHYTSLKAMPFSMLCMQCGPRPSVLVMDAICNVVFTISPSADRLN